MTEEERNAMNGDVKTYNINRPVKWAEYKALPDDLKREYWRNMQGCGGTAVWLRDYMGVSDVSIINAARAAGVPFRRGGGDSTLGASCEARWNTADAVEITRGVNESHTEGAESAQERTEDSGECSKYPPEEKLVEALKMPTALVHAKLVLSGGRDDILLHLKLFLPDSGEVTVEW